MRISFIVALLLSACALSAQQINSRFSARERGWVTFGIDGGLAYQSSDVRTTFNGWGAGLTLAKNLAYRPGGALSFDLRGRLLFTRSYGRDWRTSTGLKNNQALNGTYAPSLNYLRDQSSPLDSSFVFANHRTGMGELGLEGVLTFNRLRERTGIVFSLFGGIGLDLFRTRIDQTNANGQIYNYVGLDNTGGRRNTLANLTTLRDGTYESPGDGSTGSEIQGRFMPGAGFELGYQVAPRFVIGIGHKTTFSRTDILDGQRWTNNNVATSSNDWAHYTSLHLRWDIERRQKQLRPPNITVTDPERSPFISPYPNHFVRARITNVRSAADVTCSVNGLPQDFLFKNESFGTNVRLTPGRNEIRISAFNPAGSDAESVIIVWENYPPPPPGPPVPPPPTNRNAPVVQFTDPGRTPFNTNRTEYFVQANVRYVNDRRDIRFYVNGTEQTQFSYAENFEATVRLREGRNTLRIEAQNNIGRQSDEVEINVDTRTSPPPPGGGQRPTVNITQPRGGNATTANNVYELRASVQNIDSRDDITLFLNGQDFRDFKLTPARGELTANLGLKPNDNDVTIRVRNRYGEAEASALIKRTNAEPPPSPGSGQKPTINITQPRGGSATTSNKNYEFKATVKNVDNKDGIKLQLNGQSLSAFTFAPSSGELSATLDLRPDDNDLVIQATNRSGNASATATIKRTGGIIVPPPPAGPKPVVTFTQPRGGTATTATKSYEARASVQNVSNREGITVVFNGQPFNNFTFTASSGEVVAQLDLRTDDNRLLIRAKNTQGEAEATATIKLSVVAPPTPPVAKPEVTINQPVNAAVLDKADLAFSAVVRNVSAKSEIAVTLNGTSVSTFEYNSRIFTASGNVLLREGDNSLTVKATNASGSDEKTVRFRYNKPLLKPEVSILEPKNNTETRSADTELRAVVLNVPSKDNITVSLNGRAAAIESFNAQTGQLVARIRLVNGDNTIRVAASNASGSAEASVKVRYNNPKPPKVTINAPANNARVKENNVALKVLTENVFSDKNLRIVVNGSDVKDFLIDRGGNVTAKIYLRAGANDVRVIATTPDGSDEQVVNVVYEASTPKPTAVFIQPGKVNNPVVDKSYTFKAKVTGVKDRSQVRFFLNGEQVTNVVFYPRTGEVVANVELKPGKNEGKIMVTTPEGEATATAEVIFTPPVKD